VVKLSQHAKTSNETKESVNLH